MIERTPDAAGPKANPQSVIDGLRKIVGDRHVVTDPAELQVWGCDWTKIFAVDPLAAVFPGTTSEVSAVVKFCHENRIKIVPSGGRTGLAGGAVAGKKEIVISLNRMTNIDPVDRTGLTIRCEAGATTQAVQEAAAAAGLFFGLDLAAKGSCHIGGNISTNAGGLKFIRYGGMREQVLGLEVVLPDGTVLDMNSSLRKNNTGYDIKQLFIGAEGTLGIVTRATLRLTAKPRNVQLACIGVKSFDNILDILTRCNMAGATITAFEFFTDVAHGIVLKHAAGARTPFAARTPFYVILELEDAPGGGSVMEPLLEKFFEDETCLDAVIAQNSTQFKEFWGLRENITESLAAHGHVRKNDISLPVDKLAPFIKELEAEVAKAPKDIEVVLFGHIGDGNLHINYVGPKGGDKDAFQQAARQVEEKIFAILPKYKGSVSAEHGIGLLKKKDLKFSRSIDEIAFMKKIRAIIDPDGIMNPGKIF
ncbi:FAD-binding oxidoreductase [bacterium]|nr:FAD-binding oxidoreductase [bacterium]